MRGGDSHTMSGSKMNTYILWLNEQQAGPYTMTQLKGMWTNGAITAATLYWREEIQEWCSLGQLVENVIRTEMKQAEPVVTTDKATEKPIGVGENIAIVLVSLLLSLLAFFIGMIYYFSGKKQRGARLMAWSVFWFVVLYFFLGVGR